MECFNKKIAGQSLIEVVVAVGMIALLLTAVLALISLSVKNSRLAKDRTNAVSSAQQGVELMRTYRDFNWSTLLAKANGTNYDLPGNWTVDMGLSNGCPDANNIYDYYLRCVVLTQPGGGEIAVQVTVSWVEGSQTYHTVQSTNLSLWER
ncbi:hypothetical protein L6272_05525 [Microgenomates group bacterium]|nr:hypothetical protein [Microgenomates group bacterium]